MRNWKRKSRHQRKVLYKAWKEGDNNNKSKWGIKRRGKKNVYEWEGWGHRAWRKSESLECKRDIKHVKEGLAKFAEFPYYQDCRYHVCKQVEIIVDDRYPGQIDIKGESLINGSGSNCSYEHCGIVHLTKEEGEKRVQFAKDMGMLPYSIKYAHDLPKDKVESYIRYSKRIEEIWNFNKRYKTDEITDKGKEWILKEFDVVFDSVLPMSDEEIDQLPQY